MATGWADWSEPRQPREVLTVEGAQQIQYCPECDKETVWSPVPNDQLRLGCQCGFTLSSELTRKQLGRIEARYP